MIHGIGKSTKLKKNHVFQGNTGPCDSSVILDRTYFNNDRKTTEKRPKNDRGYDLRSFSPFSVIIQAFPDGRVIN